MKIKASFVSWAVFAMSLAAVIVGMIRKEHLVIFRKAAAICFECIGIG